jgi:hypothetical protein
VKDAPRPHLTASAATFLQRIRPFGPLSAWAAAVFAGWKLWDGADLLTIVLRGGEAWLAVIIIWRFGMSWLEQAVSRQDQSS